VLEIVRRVAAEMPDLAVLAVAPYLSPRIRASLKQVGINYADMTGNIYIALDQPPMFVEKTGAVRDPWPDDKPLQTLKGPGASKAVRAFCDFSPPYGIRELAQRARVPAPTLSRVAEVLERDGLLTRDGPRGPITFIDWASAIRLWTQDYSFVKSNRIGNWLEPRGVESLLNSLRGADVRYALTGTVAARSVAPTSSLGLAALYVERPESAARSLGLRPSQSQGNVLLALPYDSVVFDRGFEEEDLKFAALSQVAADLLSGPGRWPVEGEELIKWMERNERAWRA
jgi:hypothetical protein